LLVERRVSLVVNAPAAGVRWVQLAWQTLLQQPLRFCALMVVSLCLLMFMSGLNALLGGLGSLLALACLPWISLSFMLGSSSARTAQMSVSYCLAQPFRAGPRQSRNLLLLGLFYALLSTGAMWLCDTLDGGRFHALQLAWAQAQESRGQTDRLVQIMSDPMLKWALLLRLSVITLLGMPFWHAPALTHWARMSVPKALFSSALACWRNKWAFVLYGLGWLALMLGGFLVFLLLSQVSPALGAAVSSMLFFSLMMATYVSFFFTFDGCFEPQERAMPAAVPPPMPDA
jgi:hypothetical protein